MVEATAPTRSHDFSDNAGGATDKVDADQLDNEFDLLFNAWAALIEDLNAVLRDDNTLQDQVVRIYSLHEEITDLLESAGLDPLEEVELASTADVDLDSAPATFDGVAPTASDRILIRAQDDASENGIYTWASAGTAMTRAADMDADGDFPGTRKLAVRVNGGDTLAHFGYFVDELAPTIGTTDLTWKLYRRNMGRVTAAEIVDETITLVKLVDGILSADSAGLAKMADGFLSADASGRAKMADLYVNTAKLAANAVTNAKLAAMAQNTIKGRIDSGAGDPEDLTADEVRQIAFENAEGEAETAHIKDGAVTAAKIGAGLSLAKLNWASPIAINSAVSLSTSHVGKILEIDDSGTPADYTITLDELANWSNGESVAFIVKPTVTKVITIDGNGSETIDGLDSIDLVLTNILIITKINGSWIITFSKLETPWQNGGVITIDATSVNPGKGTTSVDRVWWRRIGDSMEMRGEYKHSTGGSSGTGEYLFGIPFGRSINTDKVHVETSSGVDDGNSSMCGLFSAGKSGSFALKGHLVPYDSSYMRVYFIGDGVSKGFLGNSVVGLDNADLGYSYDGRVPILGW